MSDYMKWNLWCYRVFKSRKEITDSASTFIGMKLDFEANAIGFLDFQIWFLLTSYYHTDLMISSNFLSMAISLNYIHIYIKILLFLLTQLKNLQSDVISYHWHATQSNSRSDSNLISHDKSFDKNHLESKEFP